MEVEELRRENERLKRETKEIERLKRENKEIGRLKKEIKALKQASTSDSTKHNHSAEFWVAGNFHLRFSFSTISLRDCVIDCCRVYAVEHMMKNDTDGIKRLIQEKTISKDDVDKEGFSLLGHAAYYGNLAIAKRMR